MKLLYLCTLCFLFVSCNETNSHNPKTTYRDSVLNFYKAEIGFNRNIDTTDFNFKFLQAYSTNDTLTLSNLFAEIKKQAENREWRSKFDSCISLVGLNEMDINEGYRFEYDGAFCNLRQITTLYKQNDSFKVNFQLYQLRWDTAQCRKIEEFNRAITKSNWEDFLIKVHQGDFWGLKSMNYDHGVDGSTFYITGFKKGTQIESSKHHFVYRWGSTSLNEAFNYATLLSGNTKGCFWVRSNN